jgi:hypothetical protein
MPCRQIFPTCPKRIAHCVRSYMALLHRGAT